VRLDDHKCHAYKYIFLYPCPSPTDALFFSFPTRNNPKEYLITILLLRPTTLSSPTALTTSPYLNKLAGTLGSNQSSFIQSFAPPPIPRALVRVAVILKTGNVTFVLPFFVAPAFATSSSGLRGDREILDDCVVSGCGRGGWEAGSVSVTLSRVALGGIWSCVAGRPRRDFTTGSKSGSSEVLATAGEGSAPGTPALSVGGFCGTTINARSSWICTCTLAGLPRLDRCVLVDMAAVSPGSMSSAASTISMAGWASSSCSILLCFLVGFPDLSEDDWAFGSSPRLFC
jgi:hypothetical protein